MSCSTPLAQARSECWYWRCRLPGARVEAGWTPTGGELEAMDVQLCGLHAEVVALVLEGSEAWQVGVYRDPLGLTTVVLEPAA